jgi:hypothetical protein
VEVITGLRHAGNMVTPVPPTPPEPADEPQPAPVRGTDPPLPVGAPTTARPSGGPTAAEPSDAGPDDAGPTAPAGPPAIRIGNAERSAAMKALDEHFAQGRLSVEEYGDRSATAAGAAVVADLAALFTDLPAPHPVLPGGPAQLGVSWPGGTVTPHPVSNAPAAQPGGVLPAWGPRLVAVTPILALVLFLATHQWWWWLLIPAIGALVYGGGDHRSHGRRDRRRR